MAQKFENRRNLCRHTLKLLGLPLVYWQGSFLERNLSLNEERGTYISREKSLSYYEKINPIYGQIKNSYSCQNIFYRIFSFLRKAFSFSAILIFWWSFFPPYLLPPKLLRRIFVLGAPIFMRRSFIVLHMSWNLSLNFWGLYLNAWKAQKSSKISPAKKKATLNEIVFFTKLIRQTVHLLNDKAWLFFLSLWSGNA